METQPSIYTKGNLLNENYFLPDNTENLYEPKKTFHLTLCEICEKIEQKPLTEEKQILNIAYYLHKNTHFKKAILGETSDYSNPKSLENLAKMNNGMSLYKMRKTKEKIENAYIKKILNYKKENNLLTYTDLQKLKKINNQKDLEKEIVNTLKINHKYTYSEIARRYNLKDGRVAKKIIEKNYIDIYTKFEEKEEDTIFNRKYKKAA